MEKSRRTKNEAATPISNEGHGPLVRRAKIKLSKKKGALWRPLMRFRRPLQRAARAGRQLGHVPVSWRAG
jgi:hypothetical protein